MLTDKEKMKLIIVNEKILFSPSSSQKEREAAHYAIVGIVMNQWSQKVNRLQQEIDTLKQEIDMEKGTGDRFCAWRVRCDQARCAKCFKTKAGVPTKFRRKK